MRLSASSSARWSAALLPLAAWGVALAFDRQSPLALIGHPRLVAIAGADTLIVEAMIATIAAPLAGVAAASHGRTAGEAARSGAVLVGIAVLVSMAVGLAAWRMGGMDPGTLLRSHATLGAVALALCAAGIFAAAVFRHPLDAAAAAVLAAVTASGALLAAGPATSHLSQPAIDAGLLASPVVATAAAAGIDVVRSDLVYRVSPIAHRRFEYPAWHVATLAYLLAAGCLAGAASVGSARRVRARA